MHSQLQDATLPVKRLSALAQLVAILIERGTTSTGKLVEATGYNQRSIWRAKRELGLSQSDSGDTDTRVTPPDTRVTVTDTRVSIQETECESVHKATRATKESPSEIVISKIDSPFIPQDPYDRVKVENGRLVLFNGLKQFWLEKFGGDEERLMLALVQVAGYIQGQSRRPLEAQVSSQLARIAAEKRDRDTRYAKAVDQNRSVPRAGFAQQEDSGSRVRRLLAARSEGGVQ